LSSSNKEDTGKLIEIVTEKMKTRKDKEETIKILEALSQRTIFLENEENNISVPEKNKCIFENSCYTSKYKNSPCPCEFYRI
jgi:hypothetical protein